MKTEQSVPKRPHINLRRRGITQKKAYNSIFVYFKLSDGGFSLKPTHLARNKTAINFLVVTVGNFPFTDRVSQRAVTDNDMTPVALLLSLATVTICTDPSP
jgi:hypothetical protein